MSFNLWKLIWIKICFSFCRLLDHDTKCYYYVNHNQYLTHTCAIHLHIHSFHKTFTCHHRLIHYTLISTSELSILIEYTFRTSCPIMHEYVGIMVWYSWQWTGNQSHPLMCKMEPLNLLNVNSCNQSIIQSDILITNSMGTCKKDAKNLVEEVWFTFERPFLRINTIYTHPYHGCRTRRRYTRFLSCTLDLSSLLWSVIELSHSTIASMVTLVNPGVMVFAPLPSHQNSFPSLTIITFFFKAN